MLEVVAGRVQPVFRSTRANGSSAARERVGSAFDDLCSYNDVVNLKKMSSRRRIGVSIATTEAARRQLMQPVPCWEKQWVTPGDAPAGSTLKVYRWVKTEKRQVRRNSKYRMRTFICSFMALQNFSDDEDETLDEPLAPLPDEPEANDADDEEQDEAASASGRQTGQASPAISRAVSEPGVVQDPEETAVRKPHPLSVSLVPDSPTATQTAVDGDDALLVVDAALKPLEDNLEMPALGTVVDATLPDLGADGLGDLTMADLGPDGTQFEGTGDLGQLQGTDSLLGGELMDQSGDPFEPTE